MNKKILIGAGVLVVVGVVVFALVFNMRPSAGPKASTPTPSPSTTVLPGDANNATYLINGAYITFQNGKTSTGNISILSTPVSGDLDGDGVTDQGIILVQKTGTTSNYYVAAALGSTTGSRGTNGYLLANSSIVQNSMAIQDGKIIENYSVPSAKGSSSTSTYVGLIGTFVVKGGILQPVDVKVAN